MNGQFKKTKASFKNAFNGLAILLKEERNARIHAIATIVAIGAGIFFSLNPVEWCLIIFAIGLVFTLEAINTVIENTMNFMSTERHPQIGKIKDIAAGAVLIAAITAIAIACLIFIPKIWLLL